MLNQFLQELKLSSSESHLNNGFYMNPRTILGRIPKIIDPKVVKPKINLKIGRTEIAKSSPVFRYAARTGLK